MQHYEDLMWGEDDDLPLADQLQRTATMYSIQRLRQNLNFFLRWAESSEGGQYHGYVLAQYLMTRRELERRERDEPGL